MGKKARRWDNHIQKSLQNQMESEREQIWDLSIGQTEPYKKLSSIPKLYLEMYGER